MREGVSRKGIFMITKNKYRISVLTDRLLRLEYQEAGRFVDLPTQAVESRDFPEVETRIREEGEGLVLETGITALFTATPTRTFWERPGPWT